ncbi:MAG: S-layer protein [bacterium]|nr:S-layer protein [bacterium]
MQEKFIRKTMKRIAAIGTGVAMVGATLTGAMAVDLSDYPQPFVVDGVYDDTNALVVGDEADAADTLGLVDISSGLQFESKVAVESDSTEVSVSGGKTEQVALHLGLSNTTFFDTQLQDDDVSNLFDGEITFQGSSYDTSEQLEILDRTDPVVETSLTSSDDDYVSDVYLEVKARDQIKFYYKFDETINLRKTSSTDALSIDFLGDNLKITSIDSAGNKFTAYVGEEHYLGAGESVDVDVEGVIKTITLTDVSSTNAVVDVDGESKIISSAATSTVNGVEITVDSVFSRTEREESSANLIIGKQSSESYTDGDAYIGEDTDSPNWVWNLEGLEQNGTTMNLSIENDFVYNTISNEAKAVGECIVLPNEYVEICFDSLSVEDDDYATYTFEFDSSADLSRPFGSGNASVPGLHIYTSASDGIELRGYTTSGTVGIVGNVSSTQKAKDIWLYVPASTNGTVNGSAVDISSSTGRHIGVFYKDTSNSQIKFFGELNANVSGTEILRLNYGNTKDTNIVLRTGQTNGGEVPVTINLSLAVTPDTSSDILAGYDNVSMIWGTVSAANGQIDSLGDTRSTEEARELSWGLAALSIGTKDEDHRSAYGIIIKNPKSNGASDRVSLSIPGDQVKANIVIKGTSSTVAGGDVSYVAVAVTPVTKLASEVGSVEDYNLILVGGPCANALVEELFDYTCDGWSFEAGEAVVKMVDNGDKVAMLVAGTSADDTRRASKAIASYADYEFTGTEALVSGTSLTDIDVGAVSAAEEVVAEEEVVV